MFPPHELLQLSHKDKEAEFWRIVEDGEDVVEVRPALPSALVICVLSSA